MCNFRKWINFIFLHKFCKNLHDSRSSQISSPQTCETQASENMGQSWKWNLAVTTLTSYWWHLLAAIVEDFYRGNWNSRVDCSMQVANSGHNDKKTKTKANKGKLEFRSWLHHRYFTDSLVSNLGQSLFQKMNFQTFFMQVSHHVNMYCVLHNQIFD